MRLGGWLAGAFFLLITPWCSADEKASAGFASGFEQLAALGIPKLPADAQWSALPADLEQEGSRNLELPKPIKGNAWLLPPSETGKRRSIPLGEIFPVDLDPPPEAAGESPGLLGKIIGSGDKKTPEYGTDLAKDIKTLCAGLENMKKFDDEDDFRASWNHNGAPTFGPLLLFATQLHQIGRPDLANQLALALLNAAPSREVVIDAGINQFGNLLHAKATSEFFETKDWKAYHTTLAALVAKLPRGWDNQTAVAMLLEPLKKRAAGDPPTTPKLDGIEIDRAALDSISWMTAAPSASDAAEKQIPPEVAAQLARLPAGVRARYLQQISGGEESQQFGTWLLEMPDSLQEKAGTAAPTVRLGMAALPVLAALLDDFYLVARPNPGSSRSRYSSSSDDASERMLQAYAELNRPASRADFAKLLLTSTLPDPENEIGSSDAQTLREMTLDFWKQNRNKSREDLAIVFLTEGSSEQKAGAAKILAASANPEHHKALEAHILGEASAASQIAIVQAYLQQRKAAAKPFYDLYVKALREEMANAKNSENNGDIPWELRERNGLDQINKQLEALVSGKSAQARAREIARGDPKEAKAAIPAFLQSLSDTTVHSRLLVLLSGALAAEDPTIRGEFINNTFRLGDDSESEGTENGKTDRTVQASEAEAWKKLLDDDREIPANANRGQMTDAKTFSQLTAVALEYSVRAESFNELQLAQTITGRSFAELALARATARLAGGAIPLLPDASKVSPTRLAEIVSAAGTKAPLEIHPFLKTLADDERAAWLKWIHSPGDLAVPDNVRKLNHFITRHSEKAMGVRNTPDTFGIDVGFEITGDSLDAKLRSLAATAKDHSRSMLLLTQTGFSPGLEVAVSQWEMPKETNPQNAGGDAAEDENRDLLSRYFNSLITTLNAEDLPPNAEGAIYGMLSTRSEKSIEKIWWVIDGKLVPQKTEEALPSLSDVLTEKLSTSVPFYFQLQIMSHADARKLKKSE